MESLEQMPAIFDDQYLAHVAELASKANRSLKDLMAYEDAADRYYYNMITKEEIMKEGFKKGFEEGLNKGRQEALLLMVARNLKTMGCSYEDISKATGLPIDTLLSNGL